MVDHNNPFAGNAFSNPAAREVLSALPGVVAGAKVAPAGAATPGKHITPDQIDLYTIISKLDGDFIQAYLMKLEEAKMLLKTYLDRLGDFSRRIEKADTITKKVLGEDALIAKMESLKETIAKLNAHELASLKRLRNG